MDRLSSPPPTIKRIQIPRVAGGDHYASPRLNATVSPDVMTSPSYVINHLSTRRLSEIDKPFYLPELIYSSRSGAGIGGTSASVPLRIRTDVNTRKYMDTTTDRRVRGLTSADNSADYIRFSNYPATSAVIGLVPPRIHPVEEASQHPEDQDEVEKDEIVATTTDQVDQYALFNNTSLAYQRICFLLSRYPAVALCIISTWMLWGRGMGLTSVTQNEQVAYIVAFSAGCFILLSQVFLSSSHHNSYKSEKILANLYHFSNLIGLLISVTVIVFSAISFQNAQNANGNLDECSLNDLNTTDCISPSERTIYLSVMIGASSLITILYVFSGFYGCIGQSLMKKKRDYEMRKYSQGQVNKAFRF